MKKILNLLVLLGIIELSNLPAQAYLDPGTGSMILQTIIATFVAAGIAVKSFWAQIKFFFSSKKESGNDNDE